MKVKHYDGLGNTFCIVDYDEVQDLAFTQLAKQLCNGEQFATDGLIIVKTNPLEMIFYNRDGSYSSMCGNGIRCFAKYVLDAGILDADVKTFTVITGAGSLLVEIVAADPFLCKINMGRPSFTPAAVKLADQGPLNRQLEIQGQTVNTYSVLMGTVHTVVFVDNLECAKNHNLGEQIHKHPLFTEKTNVNFVKILANDKIAVRTFEKGVGFTKACGTGCCASFVIAKKLGFLTAETVTVCLEAGNLTISATGNCCESDIYMLGPARYNYGGEVTKALK